jgi:3-phenylpropionate/trans-cinnamate dioxygenase ferredoxin component
MYKKLVKLGEIQEGLIKVVRTKYANIAITKIEGKIIAFEDVCTHDGEAISSGKLESGCIVCPRHFAKFDLASGKALCMPATEDLVLFQTKVSGDDIEVEIED